MDSFLKSPLCSASDLKTLIWLMCHMLTFARMIKKILRATVLSEHSAQTYKGSGLPFNFIVYDVFCMFKSHWTSTLQSIDPIG